MKPAAADTLRRRELAQIHIAKASLGMDEDVYRNLVFTLSKGQTRSAGDLDWTGRKQLLDHMKKAGWQNRGGRPSDPTSRKVRSLWLTLRDMKAIDDASERALRSFVKRTAHVDRLEWLSAAQASTVIEALKGWIARLKAPADA